MAVTAGLVGRDAELQELESVLAEAATGRQRVALVCGDPGIGKTAVIEALAATAGVTGFRTVWGRCWEGGGTAPYWPWTQVLRGCAGGGDADLLTGVEPAEGTDQDRSRLFDDVASRITAAVGSGLVVALDDLHAADEGSLQLLRFLARAGAPVPLLVVGTYRVSEVARSAPHQTAIAAVGRHGPTLRLRGLPREQVEVLLERAGATVDRAGVDEVHRVTDGNPFLVYEAARVMGDRPGVDLPSSAGAVVRARLDPLAPGLREVLVAAAVVGREFPLGVLSRMLDRPPDDLLDPLADAERQFVVEEVGLGRWSFSHALLREALLEGLDEDERRTLHRRAGAVLEQLHGRGWGSAPEVAHHLAEGHDVRAPEACARAGEAALAASAFEDAARWFRRALEHLPESQARHRYDLLLALGGALLSAGSEVEARDAHHRAIRVARALGSVELAAEAAIRVAPISRSDALVIGALDDALCDLPDEDSPLRARVLVSFASVLGSSSVDRHVVRQISRQGRDMARRIGDPETLWSVLRQWHVDARGDPASVDDRLEAANELLAAADHGGDPSRVLFGRQARAEVLFEAGRCHEARAEAEGSLAAAAALNRPPASLAALQLLAGIALVEGRQGDAQVLSEQAAAVSRRCETDDGDMHDYQARIALGVQQGRFDEVERLSREATDRWTVTALDCWRQIPRVVALAELGRVQEAATLLDSLVGDHPVELSFGMIVPDIGWVPAPRLCCPTALAEACCRLEDRTRAAALYDALLASAELHVTAPWESRGVVARYLGQVAALLGRYDEADAHFRLAHRRHDSMDLPLWAAHGRLDHGRMLQARGGHGDRQEAAELLAEARDRFDALGMAFYRRRAADLLDSARRSSSTAALREQDGSWTFGYAGRDVRLRDSKGVRFLARLLREPGREMHALELAGDDPSGATAEAAERARQSVTRALKGTVDRLDDVHPALGAHLRATLRIGVSSAYVPDPRAPTTWE